MNSNNSSNELYHDIFGSILDRTGMSPYLLLETADYKTALMQATRMMGNRGFDTYRCTDLEEKEKRRALDYIEKAYGYCFRYLFPFLNKHFDKLINLVSENGALYRSSLDSVIELESRLKDRDFREITESDPRHILLLASSKKYPHVFYGYKNRNIDIPPGWQQMACAVLKVAYIVKSIEEDSQDINDYAQLGLFLEINGQSLDDLYSYDWEDPAHIPDTDQAQRAFVKISTFFHKLKESVTPDNEKQTLVFNSGDGVNVEIEEIRARLKSPESMFTKLGKSVEGESHNIRDVLAITFILKNGHDTLKLFHALQKRGVILQENTISPSITQTLFESPEEMVDAVRTLMISLAKSGGKGNLPDEKELLANAKIFYEGLSINAEKNPYTSRGHKKFQCKINYSVPIHRRAGTNRILVPGTDSYARRHQIDKKTEQHTLALELRISDRESWTESEYKEDSHHEAYKFRQLISVMNRIFRKNFYFPEERLKQLRQDQKRIFITQVSC